MNRIVIVDDKLCIGCGACVSLCPKKKLTGLFKVLQFLHS